MLRNLVATGAAAAVVLWSGVALAQPQQTAQPAQKLPPLAKEIGQSILTYTRYSVFDDVSANLDGGVVTLTGKVTMPFKAKDLTARIERLPGVTAVRDDIQVLPVSIYDDQLRYVLARRIYGNSAFQPYAVTSYPPIHIIVDHGNVTLTGVVNSNVDRVLARHLVSLTFGVFSVNDELRTDAEMKALGYWS